MSGSRSRASDAERAAVWRALDSARDDGILDPLDHLERTRAASRATFVHELRPLIANLRGDVAPESTTGGHHESGAAPRKGGVGHDPVWHDRPDYTVQNRVLGLGIAIIVAAVVMVAMLVVGPLAGASPIT